jgi:maltose 6'-phosphate phosphatase
MKFKVLIFFIIFTACSKSPDPGNQKPVLTLNYISNGLKLTMQGSATDSDGKVSALTIHWGDNLMNTYANNDFSQLTINHTYTKPASYDIRVTAIDNMGDSTFQIVPVAVSFKETSLEGIKQNLFKTAENEYLILTINLHTYQETMQNEKFNLLTDVIGLMDIDFIAFQECAQNKSAAIVDGIVREDNMALEITSRLKEKYGIEYNYVWNWAHYGWDVWEEGVSIVSKHPRIDSEDRYVSTSTSTNTITSRKVIFGAYQIPEGNFHFFSAHTHWRTSLTDEEQNKQIANIKSMVFEKESWNFDALSFVCGDFNGNPTSDFPWSEGYNNMVKDNLFQDTFLAAYPDANNKPAQSIYNTIGGDLPGRIDFIFMKSNARLTVVDSQIIFTGEIVGRVSDHFGVLTKVKF